MGRGRVSTKRVVDVLGAATAFLLLSPILALAACAVFVTMGAPISYRDTCAGLGGRPFELLKFRTMRALRPGETIPDSDGARITRVGRVLRATSIDELPSLINVLRGDLSLVGPRPLPVRYVARLFPDAGAPARGTPGYHRLGAGEWSERHLLGRSARARRVVRGTPISAARLPDRRRDRGQAAPA